MSSKILIILVSFALLFSLGISEALAQPPPLVPPLIGYGTAFRVQVGGDVPLGVGQNVSIRMDLFLVIFLDSSGDQALIGNISSELQAASASGGTVPLPNLQAAFADSSNPPMLLSGNTSVSSVAPLTTQWPVVGCWQVVDWGSSDTYTVQIIQPVPAKRVLEVYQHNGVVASCTTGNYSSFNYWVLIPLYSDKVLGEGDYVIREAGKATTGDVGYAYVNDIRSTKIEINDTEVTPPRITIGEDMDVIKLDVYAPSEYGFTMELAEGWNWISFPIGRCFYQGNAPTNQPSCVELVNINSLGFSVMADWFTSIVEPDGAWQAVIGEFGSMNVDIDSSYHSLKYMSAGSGYRVRIKDGVSNATISFSGPLFDAENCVIHLLEGWNWIGFPLTRGYYDTASPPTIDVPPGTTWVKVNAPASEYVFSQIVPYCQFIIGEFGSYNADYPEYSSLHYFAPGRAYRIKVDQGVDLRYQ